MTRPMAEPTWRIARRQRLHDVLAVLGLTAFALGMMLGLLLVVIVVGGGLFGWHPMLAAYT